MQSSRTTRADSRDQVFHRLLIGNWFAREENFDAIVKSDHTESIGWEHLVDAEHRRFPCPDHLLAFHRSGAVHDQAKIEIGTSFPIWFATPVRRGHRRSNSNQYIHRLLTSRFQLLAGCKKLYLQLFLRHLQSPYSANLSESPVQSEVLLLLPITSDHTSNSVHQTLTPGTRHRRRVIRPYVQLQT